MSDELGIEQRMFDRVAAVYRSAYDLELVACRPDGMVVWRGPRAEALDTPTACTERELAIRESLRWGEPTFALTSDDSLTWAVPLMRNAAVLGGLVSRAPAALAPQLSLNRAAADLRRMAEHANVTNAALLESHRVAEGRERTRAEAIHALKSAPQYNLRQLYLLEEPLLAAAIRRNDRGAARHVLNKLLVGIHATAGDRFDLVKSFYAELVVTVSRTAVWAGGAPRELLQANMAGLGRLSTIGNEEHLAHWLRDMLEQAMDADRLIFLATQKVSSEEDPGPSDIYQVGTVAMVVKMLRLPDGRVKILVQGLAKGHIVEFLDSPDFFKVQIEKIPEPAPATVTIEIEALMRSVKENSEKILQLRGIISPDAVAILDAERRAS